jgi:hypothetical protein
LEEWKAKKEMHDRLERKLKILERQGKGDTTAEIESQKRAA